jgi:hypothetical protein
MPMSVEIFERQNLESILGSGADFPKLIFSSPVEFSEYVESIALRDELTISGTLIDLCEIYDIEYESLSKMLTQSIKEKIAVEFQEQGILNKRTQIEFED